MNVADALLLLGVAVFAFLGFYRGFAAQALSLGGLFIGAVVGSFVAPYLLSENSPWTPLAGLTGALVGAFVLGAVGAALGQPVRAFLAARPGLALADRVGGIAAGGFLGLALGWLVAVLALQQPVLGLRSEVRASTILPRLVRAVPPDSVLAALNRFDPLPLLPGLEGRLPPPDPGVLRSPGARAAAESVLKVHGTACGVGTQGSGWVIDRGLVATNAHVIAGQEDTSVLSPHGQSLGAQPVYVDAANDVALLRVRGLEAAPLRAGSEVELPRPVALLGYPRNGGLAVTAGTAGDRRTVIAPDAYEQRVRPRVVVPLRGRVQPGESGGPVVDRRGRVLAMIFGGTRTGQGGYAVPVELVLNAFEERLRPVEAGPCLG
ncbi:MAG TPA: MarP family serine protease [Gaiellaceae bacterium]|nr:MarP family serine protease [Gaiellaceae bacterium]